MLTAKQARDACAQLSRRRHLRMLMGAVSRSEIVDIGPVAIKLDEDLKAAIASTIADELFEIDAALRAAGIDPASDEEA